MAAPVLAIVPDTISVLPLFTVIAVLSFNATGVLIAFVVPPVTRRAAPLPELSSVSVSAPEMTNELGLVKVIPPTDSPVSRVTVRKLEPTPNIAMSPAAVGTPPLQLPAADQLPSASTFHNFPVTTVAGTVIRPDVLAVAVPTTA